MPAKTPSANLSPGALCHPANVGKRKGAKNGELSISYNDTAKFGLMNSSYGRKMTASLPWKKKLFIICSLDLS